MFEDLPPGQVYDLGEFDRGVVAAAQQLLLKLIKSGLLDQGQAATVAKLLFGMSRIPYPADPFGAKVCITSPRRRFGDVETFHWWDIEYENGVWSIQSAGHFYRPSTGGDSFKNMAWYAAPEEPAMYEDHLDQLWMVPDARSFEDAVDEIDFSEDGYEIEISDEDSDQESGESDDVADDSVGYLANSDEVESDDEPLPPLQIVPRRADEVKLAEAIDQQAVESFPARHAYGAENCDECGISLDECGLYIDGRTRGTGQWSNMCAACFARCGEGIGWGIGQLYARQIDDQWRLVAGFEGE